MRKTYNIFVIGCQMNKNDSERIANYLDSFGYTQIDDQMKADIVIMTTCGVRQSAEDRVYMLIPRIKKKNPKAKIVLTGCLSERKDVIKRLEKLVDVWLPIAELQKLGSLLQINKYQEFKELDYFKVGAKYDSDFSAFVPIGNGCNNFCSYCVVPYARGREKYRPAEDILNEVKILVDNGYKEITLIAQNVNSYKCKNQKSKIKISSQKAKIKSDEINFSNLLKLVNDIPGNFWLRFSTSHPKDMSDELIKAMGECDKLCYHVHLPAQSGDDDILKAMNRHYTRKDYLLLIDKLRRSLNKNYDKGKAWLEPATFTTDIIIGYPGETKKQFEKSKELFQEVAYDMAYISQYSPRPGTAAAKLKDNVSNDEKKNREEELMKILRKTSFVNNKNYLNKTVEVLIERKKKDGTLLGRTKGSKVVKISNLKNSKINIGDFVNITITKTHDFGMDGMLTSPHQMRRG